MQLTVSVNSDEVRPGDFLEMDGDNTVKVLRVEGNTITYGKASAVRRLVDKLASSIAFVYWRVVSFWDDIWWGDEEL
jgi:hypothetical protein